MSYTNEQMRELQRGIRAKVDIEPYKNSELSAEQMKQIRIGLEQGVDVGKYNMPYLKPDVMKELRKALVSGVKTNVFDIHDGKGYTAEQAKEIRLGLENEQKIELYANPEFSAEQMREIRLGQRDGLNAEAYATTDFTTEQMHTLRNEMKIQSIIDWIKQSFEALWLKIKTWAETHFKYSEDEYDEGTIGTNADVDAALKDAAINKAISQAFADVYDKLEQIKDFVECDKEEQFSCVKNTVEVMCGKSHYDLQSNVYDVANMTTEEKTALVNGTEMAMDYGDKISDAQMSAYKTICAERNETQQAQLDEEMEM